MIYTSYFGKMRKLPKDIITVAICVGVPKWYKGLVYKKVAPTYTMLNDWKVNHNEERYKCNFKAEILANLSQKQVKEDLLALTGNAENIALLCFEKSEEICHRHWVAEWLQEGDIECKEWLEE